MLLQHFVHHGIKEPKPPQLNITLDCLPSRLNRALAYKNRQAILHLSSIFLPDSRPQRAALPPHPHTSFYPIRLSFVCKGDFSHYPSPSYERLLQLPSHPPPLPLLLIQPSPGVTKLLATVCFSISIMHIHINT